MLQTSFPSNEISSNQENQFIIIKELRKALKRTDNALNECIDVAVRDVTEQNSCKTPETCYNIEQQEKYAH